MKKLTPALLLALTLLLATLPAAAAPEPPRPGIGDYLCHLFGTQHWTVCRIHPGNRP